MAFEIQLQLLSATDKRRAQKARQKFNYCDGCGLRAQLAKTFQIVTEKKLGSQHSIDTAPPNRKGRARK